MIKVPDGTLRVLVRGCGASASTGAPDEPYLVGEFAEVPDVVVESDEVEALTRNVQTLFPRIIGLVPYLPEELQIAAANVDEPSRSAHFVASTPADQDRGEAAAPRARERRAAAARDARAS